MTSVAPRTPSLDGCLAKLRRASEHIKTLEDEIAGENPLIPLRKHCEFDPASKTIEARAEIVSVPTFPDRWSTILGDAIQNTRIALEYLVYELIRVETGRYWKGSQFPIATDPNEHTGSATKTIAKLGRHWAIIEQSQPYDRGPATSLQTLVFKYLQDFSNADKHRLLVPVANSASPTMGVFVLRPGKDCGLGRKHHVWVNGGVLEPGADLIRETFVVTGDNPEVHVDDDYAPLVSFSDPALSQISATDVLHMIERRAQLLVHQFKPFF